MIGGAAEKLLLFGGRGDDRGLAAALHRRERAGQLHTHGASTVGFAFTELLGFRLLPRLKTIGSIWLYAPEAGPDRWPRLERIVKQRPIDWDLISRHYDQMIKYATALRLGTAEAEQVLRRFRFLSPPNSEE